MHILMFLHGYYPMQSGAEIAAKNVAEGLIARGHSVSVITRQVHARPRQENINGVRVCRVWPSLHDIRQITDSRHNWESVAFACRAFLAGVGKGIAMKPDIFHGHELAASLAGCFAAKSLRKPFVCTIQNGIGGYDALPLEARRKAVGAATVALLKFLANHSTAMHVPSTSSKAALEGWGAKNVEVIPNSIDLGHFKPKTKKGGKAIISVSTLTGYRGLEFLLDAMPHILQEVPDTRLKLIGYGPAEKKFRKMAETLGIAGRVEFAGFVPNTEVPKHLAEATVFVRPSLREGFGIAFVEAMAAGIPAIGTRLGGITDIIDDGYNGLLVKPMDADSLAEAVIRLLKDEALRKRLVANGLECVKERYSIAAVAKRFETLYEKALKANA